MAERTSGEYETMVFVNGSQVAVRSKRIRWNGIERGKPHRNPETYLDVDISTNDGKHPLYFREKEITHEFPGYAALKHRQIVCLVKKCSSLEEITKAVNGALFH